MSYDTMYAQFQLKEKELKDVLGSQQKLFKRLAADMEKGDLTGAEKSIAQLAALTSEYEALVSAIGEITGNFDAAEYMRSGDFTKEMVSCFENASIDVKGEGTIYEVFPYKVKIDAENMDVYMDRKRFSCARPSAFVSMLKTARDKLMRAGFNPDTFLSELASIYDLALTLQGKKDSQADLYLTALYKFLTPMRRFRKDYNPQDFAFDLARLYISGTRRLEDGRQIQFGPSRQNNKAIRILDANGQEQYLATVRFFQE